jgi:hypothetical protein
VLLMTFYDDAPPGFFGLVLLLTKIAVDTAGYNLLFAAELHFCLVLR